MIFTEPRFTRSLPQWQFETIAHDGVFVNLSALYRAVAAPID